LLPGVYAECAGCAALCASRPADGIRNALSRARGGLGNFGLSYRGLLRPTETFGYVFFSNNFSFLLIDIENILIFVCIFLSCPSMPNSFDCHDIIPFENIGSAHQLRAKAVQTT